MKEQIHNLKKLRPYLAAAVCFVILTFAQAISAQKLSNNQIHRGRTILKIIKSEMKEHYYDPQFRGIDLDSRFNEAEEMIKQASSEGEIFAIIALLLVNFNDSHTYFIPPFRIAPVEYGWRMQMVGDKCLVVAVKAGSDAEARGLKAGDEVLAMGGMRPSHADLWKIDYFYNIAPKIQAELTVRSPGEPPRDLVIKSKVLKSRKERINEWREKPEKGEEELSMAVWAGRYHEIGQDLFIWRMHSFDFHKDRIDEMMNKARKFKTLIIDLRGNGGGYEETMLRLIGHFIDEDLQIGELVRRKERLPLRAKTIGKNVFRGKLVVIVDSKSASAAEIFARAMQMRKRATIIGDRSAGAVMRGRHYEKPVFDSDNRTTRSIFAVSITDADIVMADGKSLEHFGMIPDEIVLPTEADIVSGRDSVLSHAAALLDVKIEPERAAKFFPFDW
ncbi:MAG TPA: S41 family peptidase [Pyrinomonadaceae bacterium]|nr:S41 family peptidase [Pyrinomonadaceae bacterium]